MGAVVKTEMTTADGNAMVRRLRKHRKANNMDSFQKMVAERGIVRIAKAVVARGHSSAIGEAEFTKAITEHAMRDARTGESDAQAFSRVFCAKDETGFALRKAVSIIKGMPAMAPVS
jgi:hypothetical protein